MEKIIDIDKLITYWYWYAIDKLYWLLIFGNESRKKSNISFKFACMCNGYTHKQTHTWC